MKKRDDIRARAAYMDIHNGLTMALRAMSELDRDNGSDYNSAAVLALEKAAIRAAKWARKRVTARIDDEIDATNSITSVTARPVNCWRRRSLRIAGTGTGCGTR